MISGTASYGSKGHINTPTDAGRWPSYNSTAAPVNKDQDGMADKWEEANQLNPHDPSDRNHFNLNADYTNLEVYLNSLAQA